MTIQEQFIKVLNQTETRFEKYRQQRESKEALVAAGKVFDVNSTELVEQRLARLRFDARTARAMVSEGLAFTPTAPGTAVAGDPVALERVLGTNDLMSIRFLEQGVSVSRAVARVHIGSQSGLLGYGTGFMVSPRLFLTNNHVLADVDQAAGSQVEFNFEVGAGGVVEPSVFVELAPDEFFLTEPELDYSLVAVRPNAQLAGYGWLRLIDEQGKLMVGEWVNIIQHPNGEPKQLALRENQVIDELEQWLHYHTDTAPGSSGSPVFNDQWEVVALHHSGVPERDAQGRILTRDGRVWDSWMGEHRVGWRANEGARISRVVAHIKAQHLDSEETALRAQMFEAEPPGVPETEPPEGKPATPLAARLPDTRLAAQLRDSNGSAVWTIPITITVKLGRQALSAARAEPATRPEVPSTPVEEFELEKALAELAQARARVYYDREADAAAAAQYYDRVQINTSAKKLFKALSKLTRSTHVRTYNYKPSRYVYPWVDLHPDLSIRSVYSGRSFDPAELIREDFRIAGERAVRLRQLMLPEASLSQERLEIELDLLEARLPYNCEHVVPQSWYQKKEPMRGDLHHLFACESGCNSFRSNIPYYDFPDFEEAVRDACGKRLGGDKFEPSSGKGAASRATLYFLLRYPGQVGDENRELQRDRLPVLLAWHDRFPPDEYERHRNMAIFEKQGNRNPLIDHPDWARKIDFRRAFG